MKLVGSAYRKKIAFRNGDRIKDINTVCVFVCVDKMQLYINE